MLNQVVLMGKVVSSRETSVDNGRQVVLFEISMPSTNPTARDIVFPIRADGFQVQHLDFLTPGSTVAVKGRLHMDPTDGMCVVAERITCVKPATIHKPEIKLILVLQCEHCGKEILSGEDYYEGTDGTIVCDGCDDGMTMHELTQYDDHPYIDENEGAGWDGAQYEGEQFVKKGMV